MFLIDENFWEVKKTKRKGKGVLAEKEIKKGMVIGDYVGKLIHISKIDFDKEKKNLYLMSYNDEYGIYPDLTKSGVHLLNHSCSPNCFIYKYKDRTLVFASKDIKIGEELTISYLLPPRKYCKPCPHKCYCQSINCTGSMHLSEKKYQKWQKFQKKIFKNNASKKWLLKPLINYPKLVTDDYINGVRKFLRE